MACRSQSNPSVTSSDGVPPELAVLGFQRSPAWTGQTGRRHRSDQPAQGFVGVDRSDDRSRVLAQSSVLAQFCVNNLILFNSKTHQVLITVHIWFHLDETHFISLLIKSVPHHIK